MSFIEIVFIIKMSPLQKGLFRGYSRKIDHDFICGSHGVFALRQNTPKVTAFCGTHRGGPMCPPASEMILDFANMSSKLTFLQWNHIIIEEEW